VVLWQVRWGAPPEHGAPAGLEARKVETAQARDLVLECSRVLVSHGDQPALDEAAGALLIR
jgi:hypothetical protein